MKIIFGTTNTRKIEDLTNISKKLNLKVQVLGLEEIGWNNSDIEETGQTLEENSLIKAQAIHEFCQKEGLNYPIITDDSGLFVDALDGKPGIYTARYGDDEIAQNPSLPKHQCIIKLLREMQGIENRKATYKSVVTVMYSDGTYFQEKGKSIASIAHKIEGEIKKPHFYAIVKDEKYNKIFSELTPDELQNTYRYQSLKSALQRLRNNIQ
ncbi:MAG: non-canonical purine NTP pyrophosphatase [Bacilli bacterium]|nr:non-canonical purine NTP pyrophosphatase [Bacilli bacterium]